MRSMLRIYSLFFLTLCFSVAIAQRDFSWKSEYPYQIIDWSQYIQMAPAYMGPHALPVPSIYEARVLDQAELEMGYTHYSHQDGEAPTNAAYTRIYYPVAAHRVGLELQFVPYESFSYSDEMADYMHTIQTSGHGGGDVYINTYIQILKQNDKRRPDLTLRYALRTASGSEVNNARHTDSPGYYFDLSLGKDVYAEGDELVRFYALLGFYVWQVPDYSKMQNDAILYGMGASYHHQAWAIKWHLGGYHGYKNDGDSPMVMRFQGDVPLSEHFRARVLYEQGFRDFPYNGIHLRLLYSFKPWG